MSQANSASCSPGWFDSYGYYGTYTARQYAITVVSPSDGAAISSVIAASEGSAAMATVSMDAGPWVAISMTGAVVAQKVVFGVVSGLMATLIFVNQILVCVRRKGPRHYNYLALGNQIQWLGFAMFVTYGANGAFFGFGVVPGTATPFRHTGAGN